MRTAGVEEDGVNEELSEEEEKIELPQEFLDEFISLAKKFNLEFKTKTTAKKDENESEGNKSNDNDNDKQQPTSSRRIKRKTKTKVLKNVVNQPRIKPTLSSILKIRDTPEVYGTFISTGQKIKFRSKVNIKPIPSRKASKEKKDFVFDSPRPTHPCWVCKKEFFSAKELTNHRKTRHGEETGKKKWKKRICNICGKSCLHLQDHKLTHRAPEDKPRLACSVCGALFTKRGMVQHIKIHQQKQHSCSSCAKSFVTKGNLKEHLVTHSNLKPFKCPRKACGKSFSFQSNLTYHIKNYHDKLRPYVCVHCNKPFNLKRILEDHVQVVHKGQKFTCPICNKGYTRKYLLNSHITALHAANGPTTICGICGNIFSRKRDLERHNKRFHSEH